MIKLSNKRILLLDDEKNILSSLKRILENDFDQNAEFVIDAATQGNDGIKLVHESMRQFKPYALAFVDINMPPGIDGIQTIKRIWEIDPDIQIVICTASSDYSSEMIRSRLQHSDNFLILKKPFEEIEIQQLAFALTKKWQLNQQNRIYIDNLENILKTRSRELVDSEQLLLQKNTHDLLTGLPNQALLMDRAQQAIDSARLSESSVGCFFIDINNFQLINDRYGFKFGDNLLKHIANRLFKLINLQVTTIARWSSDIFVVILIAKENENFFSDYAKELLDQISMPHEIENQSISVTASIGACLYPLYAEDENQLLKNASTSLNVAKKQGHHHYQMFKKEFNTTALKRVEIESKLNRAIDHNEFVQLYHPVFDLMTDKIIGIETSLVWDHPGKGILSPKQYMPVAEETGVIHLMNEWMLKTACRRINGWIEKGLSPSRITVVVNDKFLMKDDFVDVVIKIIKEAMTDPDLIQLEISGTSLLHDKVDILQKIVQLKNMGFHAALNDLGAWYGSLNSMLQVPFEKIKINKEFIQGLDEKNDHAIIVKAIIMLAKNFNLEVIAEGIETYGQLNFLRQSANDKVHGYVLKKSLTEAACTSLLMQQK